MGLELAGAREKMQRHLFFVLVAATIVFGLSESGIPEEGLFDNSSMIASTRNGAIGIKNEDSALATPEGMETALAQDEAGSLWGLRRRHSKKAGKFAGKKKGKKRGKEAGRHFIRHLHRKLAGKKAGKMEAANLMATSIKQKAAAEDSAQAGWGRR